MRFKKPTALVQILASYVALVKLLTLSTAVKIETVVSTWYPGLLGDTLAFTAVFMLAHGPSSVPGGLVHPSLFTVYF